MTLTEADYQRYFDLYPAKRGLGNEAKNTPSLRRDVAALKARLDDEALTRVWRALTRGGLMSKMTAIMDAIDFYVAASRKARERQEQEFLFAGWRRSTEEPHEVDYSLSPVKTGYAAFLACLKHNGYELVEIAETKPETEVA